MRAVVVVVTECPGTPNAIGADFGTGCDGAAINAVCTGRCRFGGLVSSTCQTNGTWSAVTGTCPTTAPGAVLDGSCFGVQLIRGAVTYISAERIVL